MAECIIPLAPGMRASYQHLGTELLGIGPEGITFGVGIIGQVKFADGSAAAPSISFKNYPTSGMFCDGGVVAISVLGNIALRCFGSQIDLYSGYHLSWNNDVALVRDAANILALKNGTNAQEFRVYGTTVGPKYVALRHDGTDSIITNASGDFYYRTKSGSSFHLQDDSGVNGTPLHLHEQVSPAAPAEAQCKIYAKDAGGGKTGLYVLFPTGAEQQIKVEL